MTACLHRDLEINKSKSLDPVGLGDLADAKAECGVKQTLPVAMGNRGPHASHVFQANIKILQKGLCHHNTTTLQFNFSKNYVECIWN